MKVTTDSCLFGAWAAQSIGKKKDANKILDIGTGTGLLSLMIAQQTNGIIEAIDIDPGAFEQASGNINGSPWGNRMTIFQGDVSVFDFPSRYDIIVSNPPFYENELASPNEKKNIAHHSQELTLQQLVITIHDQLTADGEFYLLLPYKRKEEALDLITQQSFFINQLVLVKQSTLHSWFRIMIQGSHHEREGIQTKEIAIMGDNRNYTNEFSELLTGYYLHL